MRIFLCSYKNFFLAVPMNSVSSIYLSYDKMNNIIDFDSRSRNTFISLPALFDIDNNDVCHGIVLKNNCQNTDSDSEIIEDRIILISTRILSEKEIPSGDFTPVPKALRIFKKFSVFNGIFFISSDNTADKKAHDAVLLLDPEQLVKTIVKELNA